MNVRKKIRKATQLAVIAAVIVLAGAGGWMMFGGTEPRAAPATVAAKMGNVEETVLASGSLEASSVVSVGAEVSGRIEKISVELGDHVEAGQPVVTIDSQNQQYALKTAEAALANIEAQRREQDVAVRQAQIALTRAQELGKKKLVSELDLETAQATLDSAKAKLAGLDAQIQQAKLAVDTAKVNLGRTRIEAPVSGTVVAVLVSEGQTVNANQTTPTLIKIANLDQMVIKAQISEADVTKVHPGEKAWFSILGEPDRKIDAKLTSIEPAPTDIKTSDTGLASDDSAVYYNGIFEVPNPDHHLRIAMTAQVTIVVADAKNVLTVPSGAIIRGEGSKAWVLVPDGADKAKRKPVTVGLDNDVVAEIKSGLEPGAKILAAGAQTNPGSSSSDREKNRMMRRMGRHGGFGG
ncbi:MAG TPA: efflux RND transporter periplasmic adaptor subunit [Pararhizobium sp.]|nr:efflux RND transporter periplasmic adaptor subunit [Pararhizobium sp.]